jgi:hypothetical protein
MLACGFRVVPPRPDFPRPGKRRVLPFGFGKQPVLLAGFFRQPIGVRLRVVPADAYRRMIFALLEAGVAPVPGLVLDPLQVVAPEDAACADSFTKVAN